MLIHIVEIEMNYRLFSMDQMISERARIKGIQLLVNLFICMTNQIKIQVKKIMDEWMEGI